MSSSAALPAYALITLYVNASAQGPTKVYAGSQISDSTVLAGYLAGGGQTAPTNDPIVSAAAATVAKLRAKGQNEDFLNSVMLAALAASAGASLNINFDLPLAASATVVVEPAPVEQKGAFQGAWTVSTPVQPATGESAALQVQKNGVNITGATVTLGHTTVANAVIPIPNTAGVTYVATDDFQIVVTYTAGGSPALGGVDAVVTAKGN